MRRVSHFIKGGWTLEKNNLREAGDWRKGKLKIFINSRGGKCYSVLNVRKGGRKQANDITDLKQHNGFSKTFS